MREGDCSAPVAGERFDRIVCNPPYFRGHPAHPRRGRPIWAGHSYEWLDRFAAEAAAHLTPGGRVLLVLGDAADLAAVRRAWRHPAGRWARWRGAIIWVEVLYIYATDAGGGSGSGVGG